MDRDKFIPCCFEDGLWLHGNGFGQYSSHRLVLPVKGLLQVNLLGRSECTFSLVDVLSSRLGCSCVEGQWI